MWNRVPDWLVRAVSWLVVRPQAFYLWCRFYQKCFETNTDKVQLREFADIFALEKVLEDSVWTPDGLRQFGDVMYSPKRVQLSLDRAKDEHAKIGDCDEFASYAANRILDLIKRNRTHRGFVLRDAFILQCSYRDSRGKLVGHHVAAVKYMDLTDGKLKWGHVGNWYQGKFRRGFEKPNQMVKEFHQGGRTLHWYLITADLKRTVARGFSD